MHSLLLDVLKTTDKELYHVDSSTHYVGGGSMGARKTMFNSAECRS